MAEDFTSKGGAQSKGQGDNWLSTAGKNKTQDV